MSFAFTGAPQSWTPAPGVLSARFVVDGGSGGANVNGVVGGLGGQVAETLSVFGMGTVTVVVGGAGATGPAGSIAAGGYPDGGSSGTVNGSGGGRSEVAFFGAIPELIAGGGGGAGTDAGDLYPDGQAGAGGAGGGADGKTLDGLPGADTTARTDGSVILGPGGGGGGASGATPGAAGAAGTVSNTGTPKFCPGLGNGEPLDGGPGSEGSATGAGADGVEQSGGGGDGYAGGGSGGTGAWDINCLFNLDGAGSGGGSSFAQSGT
ncbi:MAG: hypothetical protein ACRDMJ_14400, partial [Solirubrobacteraceae bacterium]